MGKHSGMVVSLSLGVTWFFSIMEAVNAFDVTNSSVLPRGHRCSGGKGRGEHISMGCYS